MPTFTGVHLIPSTGEFTYDTVAYLGKRVTETSYSAINTYAGQPPTTDYTIAINQLLAEYPGCTTISIVIAWFFNSTDITTCNIYPSTTYIGGKFYTQTSVRDHWQCSSLTEASSGLIAIPVSGGTFIYGGTPSDQSVVRCIRDLTSRGLRVIFYPFLLGTDTNTSWRGLLGYPYTDITAAATTAVNNILGTATTSQFTRDYVNLTVSYSGSLTDWTYRRMILHYANLCCVAGGVNLFVIGSELRSLEIIRGPAWTKAGTTDISGKAIWDYPFVTGLVTLAANVRSIFDGAGLTKNFTTLTNLITYSADWSDWMGYQHPGANGQWPHLDSLYASSNIDYVSLDNYMPLSDWVTNPTGLDVINWASSAPTSWPVASPNTVGLGLTGTPTIYSIPYLKANIEGGEKYNWFYYDSTNLGAGVDPTGYGNIISIPEGDRLTQSRNRYYPNQQILANKQLRWWWNNPHYAVYDNGDGNGFAPHGPQTEWVSNSKSVIFLEYGFANVDKAPNQPNLFYAAPSTTGGTGSGGGTPFWSNWDVLGRGYTPVRDDVIAGYSLQAVYEYWNTDVPSNNPTVAGVQMLQWAFCCAWNWDARPYPVFPLNDYNIWGDAVNWRVGFWLTGVRTYTLTPESITLTVLTDIANRALQLIGTRTNMTTGEYSGMTTNESIQVNIAMTPVQNWCFGLVNWNFARNTASLTVAKGPTPSNPGAWSSTYPTPPWLYEYTLPSDFVRAIYITSSATATIGYLGEPQRFAMAVDTVSSVQQEVLLTNISGAILIYTAFITNPTQWPWYFERLIVIALAKTICIALTGDKKLYEEISEALEQQINISIQVNAAEGLLIADTTPEWIQALGVNYPYHRIDGRPQLQLPPNRTSQQKPNGDQQ